MILYTQVLGKKKQKKKHGKITNAVVSSAIVANEKIYDYIIILRRKKLIDSINH